MALVVLVAGCSNRDALGPKIEAWEQPPTQPTGRLSGDGTVPSSEGTIVFHFDVTANQSGISGSFSGAIPTAGETLTTLPGSFTAFRTSSSFCADPAKGAEFEADGQLIEVAGGVNTTVHYIVKACDNGPAIVGMDTFSIDIPDRSFHADGTVVGDIQKQ